MKIINHILNTKSQATFKGEKVELVTSVFCDEEGEKIGIIFNGYRHYVHPDLLGA